MSQAIFLGDRLSGGGSVTHCQLANRRVHGRTPAVLGDTAMCERHRDTFAFVEGHPSRKWDGIPMVLEGHRLACGCHALAAVTTRLTVS